MSTGPSSTSHIDHKEQRSFECSRQLRKKPRDLSKKYNRLINPPCWRCKSWEERNSRGVASYGGIDIEDAFANGYISETTMVAHALLELEDYEETDMIWTSDFGSDIATSERSADEMDSRVTEALFHSVSIMDILKPSRRRRRGASTPDH